MGAGFFALAERRKNDIPVFSFLTCKNLKSDFHLTVCFYSIQRLPKCRAVR